MKRTVCECCGVDFFGAPIYCPNCGQKTFEKTLNMKFEKKNYFDMEEFCCRNCLYCKRANSLGGSFYCIKKRVPSIFCDEYEFVELTDRCFEFVSIEELKKI